MRVADLDLRELLEFDPRGGVLRFAGQRALLLDAVALGLLRKELIETVGHRAARGILTRFGYAHGWRIAESLRALPWDDEREWRTAGGRLHTLQGLVLVEPLPTEGPDAPFAAAVWRDSYEAEQHLLHLGRSDEPVCWTLAGFASGYLSRSNDREILCVEEQCRGCGDDVCRLVGRALADCPQDWDCRLEYFKKESLDASLAKVAEALKRTERELAERRRELARAAGVEEDPSGLIARSPGMRRALDLARRVAQVDSTVLIVGESGTGKERIARLIHSESARAAGPFVGVNCGAIPDSLLESELFGHARGAFTGAIADRPGLFEAAAGGTLLLDEIGDVPPPMQVKLLRALQEREVRRVGENRSRRVDARVLAATNRDLGEDVRARRFRQDLYYRLRVVELRLPPLRERRDDVLPLARRFLAEAAQRLGRRVTGLAPDAAARLERYGWPGNVRELENAIEHGVVLARGARVALEDLPEEIGAAAPPAAADGPGRALAEVERQHILAALEHNGGNRARTAAQLGIGEATLYRKLKQYARAGRAVLRHRS